MVNAAEARSIGIALVVGAVVLTAAAWTRGAEYDEQYTLFLTAGVARPVWPDTGFPAGVIAAVQSGHSTLAGIAHDLRATDVHPPLYFWTVSLWRGFVGPDLFIARMFSVLCGLVSLVLVGFIARRSAIPPLTAMLLTLGCYGFVYTNVVARGFAQAQVLLLCGVASLLVRRPLLAGGFLGAACCSNYLAGFVSVAVIIGAGAWLAPLTAAPFLALAAWFFAGQYAARPDQFPSFEIWPSVLRLARYEIASVFGGLPLYVDGRARIAVDVAVSLVCICVVLCVLRARPFSASRTTRLLLAGAVAPPLGLLLLGAVFNNTPIELRYLAFGTPFVALLIAWVSSLSPMQPHGNANAGEMVQSHPEPRKAPSSDREANSPGRGLLWASIVEIARQRSLFRSVLPIVFALQCVSITGLIFSPRTMQPFRQAANDAARLAGDAILLLPRGNDGVGIVGAFGIEAPASLPILLIGPTDSIAARIAPFRRVAMATLARDRESTATIPALRSLLASPDWRRIAIGSNLEVFERTQERK